MKERIKSFILIMLVVSSLYLTSRTWISERLWPEGYSLFVNVKEWPVIRNFFENEYSLPMENLGKARKIVIADGSGASAVFYNGDKTFGKVYSSVTDMMVPFLKGELEVKSATPLTKENVREMLNEQVMYAYINYPVAVKQEFFGQILGVPDTKALSSLSAVRDFFILPAGRQSIELVAVDYENEKIMRYSVGYEGTLKLIDVFTEAVSNVSTEQSCMMALQMNMDIENPSDTVKTKVLLDSFLVLDSASTASPSKEEILSKNPIKNEIPEDLITAFGYNPDSIRKYVDSEGTVIYLENDSSLKIYKNGLVEFEALDPSHGIQLDGGEDLYEALNNAIRFAGSVYSSSGASGNFAMNVSEELLFSGSDVMNFGFDYYYEGTPITTKVMLEDGEMTHAAEIKVTGSAIVSFKMLLREYEKVGEEKEIMNIYGAIDKVAAIHQNSENAVWINDMFLSYREDGDKERLTPLWAGYVNGARIIISE